MLPSKLKKLFFLSCMFGLLGLSNAFAQPLLPDLVAVTQKGMNIISWTSPYERLKTIAVQRSPDSTFNWHTIGYVQNLKKGAQAYIDGHPMPGNNWYRLQIVFGSDLNWYSNRIHLTVDSAQLLLQAVLPTNDSLQKLAVNVHFNDTLAVKSTNGITKPVLSMSIPEASGVDAFAYIKSQYVFTNPFTGHVNVDIKNVKEFKYGLKFFDDKNNDVLDIPHLPEDAVVIDRRNFPHKGMFKFELFRNKEKMETGYITIF